MTIFAAVSFARVPLDEITSKAAEIRAAGWSSGSVAESRGDPWAQTFSKVVPEEGDDPEAELRAIMGDYWLDADAVRNLLDSK